jgi:hypothetical protein
MRNVSRLVSSGLSSGLVSLLMIGCASTVPPSQYMHALEAPMPLKPGADQALVVFVRPSRFAFAIGANVLDERGRFLGDSRAAGYFAVTVPPGHHEFTVWAENTDAIAADVVAGRVYFVEVAPTMGAFSAQMHLRAIKPGLPSWQRRDEWLRSSQQYLSDFAAGQANLDRRPNDVAERLRRAREHLAKYDGEARNEHTLGPDDGIGG